MKHKVSELTDALLDAAVAKAEGHEVRTRDAGVEVLTLGWQLYSPCSAWVQGGPILERERISVTWDDIKERFYADLEHTTLPNCVQRSFGIGPSYLIAAMRAFVASKFGEEVDLL